MLEAMLSSIKVPVCGRPWLFYKVSFKKAHVI